MMLQAAQVEKVPGYVGDWKRHVVSFLHISACDSNLTRDKVVKRGQPAQLSSADVTTRHHNFDKPHRFRSRQAGAIGEVRRHDVETVRRRYLRLYGWIAQRD